MNYYHLLDKGGKSPEPQLHLMRAVPAFALFAIIYHELQESVHGDNGMWLTVYFFLACAVVWRSSACIGLDGGSIFSYDSTSQWISLISACALLTADLVSFGTKFDIIELGRNSAVTMTIVVRILKASGST